MKKYITGSVHFSTEVENRAWKLADRRIKRGGLQIKMKSTPSDEKGSGMLPFRKGR